MRKLLLLIMVSILGIFNASASADMLDNLFRFKPVQVSVYKATQSSPAPIVVRMAFNSDSIINPKALARLNGINAERIDLVYSYYKEVKSFDQPTLNRQRLDTLMKYAPSLFQNNVTEWRFVMQTGATTIDSAEKLFHGFVIYPAKAVSTKEELSFLKLTFDSVDKVIKSKDSVCLVTTVEYRKKYVRTGFYKAKSKEMRRAGIVSMVRTKKFPYPESVLNVDTVLRVDTVTCRSGRIDYSIFNWMPDSTVLKVMDRNKKWGNKLIVTDVTGSMAPYSAQLMLWFKLHADEKDVKKFVFFNDGDNKPDNAKKIGATGGIYYAGGNDGYDAMQKVVYNAMSAGSGGDGPENNMEALIKGVENCPQYDELVMIADNYAPVKDISLLTKFNKPVHIILCGVQNAYNVDYLNIARTTKGTVHTMEKDLVDLMNYKEGDTITIGNQVFKITNSKFVLEKWL